MTKGLKEAWEAYHAKKHELEKAEEEIERLRGSLLAISYIPETSHDFNPRYMQAISTSALLAMNSYQPKSPLEEVSE